MPGGRTPNVRMARRWNDAAAARGRRVARRHRARVALALSPLIAAAPVAAGDGLRSADAAADGLVVAIVDLREMSGPAPAPTTPVVRQPAWRTTFGAERESRPGIVTEVEAAALRPLAGTDVVLIQGVEAGTALRRLFPPSEWRLVVSRTILSPTDPVGFRTVRSDRPPTTAIAVRARQDLRVTARTPTLALAAPAPAGVPDAAATAVRLLDGRGRAVWLASIMLPAACSHEDPPCPALDRLDAWRHEKLKDGEPVLVGGRMAAHVPVAPTADGERAPCASHMIETDLAWERLSVPPGANAPQAGANCLSAVRLTW